MASIATKDRTKSSLSTIARSSPQLGSLACGILLLAFLPTLSRAAVAWSSNLDYSHGFIVPLFAVWYGWQKRDLIRASIAQRQSKVSVLGGCALILLGFMAVVLGMFSRVVAVEVTGLVSASWGIAWLAGGGACVRAIWPALLSLFFMVPIPGLLIDPIREQLQSISTTVGVFLLQTVGVAAQRAGTVIQLADAEVGVAEACSGLRILVSLFAVVFAVAVTIRRPTVEKIALVAMALPIAILINAIRIAVVAATVQYQPAWESNVHDLAGLLMIILAIGLVSLQLRFMKVLFDDSSGDKRNLHGSF